MQSVLLLLQCIGYVMLHQEVTFKIFRNAYAYNSDIHWLLLQWACFVKYSGSSVTSWQHLKSLCVLLSAALLCADCGSHILLMILKKCVHFLSLNQMVKHVYPLFGF